MQILYYHGFNRISIAHRNVYVYGIKVTFPFKVSKSANEILSSHEQTANEEKQIRGIQSYYFY